MRRAAAHSLDLDLHTQLNSTQLNSTQLKTQTGPHRRHQALTRDDDDGHRARIKGSGRDARALQRDGDLAQGWLRTFFKVRDEDKRAGAAGL